MNKITSASKSKAARAAALLFQGSSIVLALALPPLGQTIFSCMGLLWCRSRGLQMFFGLLFGTGLGFLLLSAVSPVPEIQKCDRRNQITQTGFLTHLKGPHENRCVKEGIFSYTFTLSEHGNRVHASPEKEARIFTAGCSFTFGMGVADSETLAAQVEKIGGPRFASRNFGTNGGGLNQVLGLVANGIDTSHQDPVIVYIVLHDHVHRFLQNGYWRLRSASTGIPRLEIVDHAVKVRSNSFLSNFIRALSWKTGLDFFVLIAKIYTRMERVPPSPSDFLQYAGAMNWAADRFFEQYPRGRFVLLLWPLHDEPADFWKKFREMKLHGRIEQIKLPSRLPLLGQEIGRPDHPKPEAYSRVADILIRHLKQTGKRAQSHSR